MYSIDIDFDALNSFIAGFFVIFMFILLIAVIVGIITLIGVAKVLKKGNKPGWGAIVPIYNVYLLCQMVGINTWWVLIIILSPILGAVPIIGELAQVALVLYFIIIFNISLARAFNKEDAFAIGLILLAPVFYLILGFEKESQYVGPKPIKDIIFESINKNKNSDTNTNTNTNTNINPNAGSTTNSNIISNPDVAQYNEIKRTCPACGTVVEQNAKYCPNCGRQL